MVGAWVRAPADPTASPNRVQTKFRHKNAIMPTCSRVNPLSTITIIVLWTSLGGAESYVLWRKQNVIFYLWRRPSHRLSWTHLFGPNRRAILGACQERNRTLLPWSPLPSVLRRQTHCVGDIRKTRSSATVCMHVFLDLSTLELRPGAVT